MSTATCGTTFPIPAEVGDVVYRHHATALSFMPGLPDSTHVAIGYQLRMTFQIIPSFSVRPSCRQGRISQQLRTQRSDLTTAPTKTRSKRLDGWSNLDRQPRHDDHKSGRVIITLRPSMINPSATTADFFIFIWIHSITADRGISQGWAGIRKQLCHRRGSCGRACARGKG